MSSPLTPTCSQIKDMSSIVIPYQAFILLTRLMEVNKDADYISTTRTGDVTCYCMVQLISFDADRTPTAVEDFC